MSVPRNIALFGTDEPVPECARHRLGDLELTLESGGLRHVRFAGREVMRGIHYLLRDGNWSTPAMTLEPAEVESSTSTLTIRFRGRVELTDIVFALSAEITADSDGGLSFRATGRAESSFDANRIGFTLLHPTPGCEDIPLTVEHLDGSIQETRFPLEISPAQPVFDIRTLRYRIDDAVDVECQMLSTRPGGQAEPFEMEDQRNWSDASFKTYVGTLLEPLPYRVNQGDVFEQEINLRCRSLTPARAGASSESVAIRLRVGESAGTQVPLVGLAVPHGEIEQSINRKDDLVCARPRHLTAYLKPDDADLDRSVAQLGELGRTLGASIGLEIELPCKGEPAEEIGKVSAAWRRAGLEPESVLACPAAYLRSYQPTAVWPDVPSLEMIYAAARQRFPHSSIGGGMLTYFTELNRKWPPRAPIDFVSHTLTPIVHAADDMTLVENLSTLTSMAATIQARMGDVPYRLGPSAISMRHNPYGSATVSNREDLRIAMGDADPRERALFGAAWTVGLIAQSLDCCVAAMTLFATSGPRSILYGRSERSQPWYDDAAGARVRPVFHVIKALAAAGGQHFRRVRIEGGSAPSLVAFAVDGDDGATLWAANLGEHALVLRLDESHAVGILDAASFEEASGNPDWGFLHPGQASDTLELDAYAVACCRPVT